MKINDKFAKIYVPNHVYVIIVPGTAETSSVCITCFHNVRYKVFEMQIFCDGSDMQNAAAVVSSAPKGEVNSRWWMRREKSPFPV